MEKELRIKVLGRPCGGRSTTLEWLVEQIEKNPKLRVIRVMDSMAGDHWVDVAYRWDTEREE